MRIFCPHCGDATTVSHATNINPATKEATCNCPNPTCQARTKHIITHSADIILPLKNRKNITLDFIISQLPETEQRRLAKKFG